MTPEELYDYIVSTDRVDAVAVIRAAIEAERERCAGIADRCAAERLAQLPEVEAAGGNVDAVVGKLSEAERIAEAIRKETK